MTDDRGLRWAQWGIAIVVFGLLLAIMLVPGCVPLGPDTSTTTQDMCAIWDQEAGTCPLLADTTSDRADTWVAANHPGVAYTKTGLSCTYGQAVTSCSIHIHIAPGLGVTLACAQQNNGQGFNCVAAVEP